MHCAGVRVGQVILQYHTSSPASPAQPSPAQTGMQSPFVGAGVTFPDTDWEQQCNAHYDGRGHDTVSRLAVSLHKNICLWFMCPFLPNFVLMLHLKMLYPTHIHWKIVVIENCHQKQHESICMTSNTVVNQSVFHVFIVSTPMRIVYIITNSYWDDWWCCHICVACAVDNEMIQSLARQI